MDIISERHRASDGAGRTALVTGASSGIGRAMSELLAAQGFDVVLVARRRDRLEALAEQLTQHWGVRGHPVVADLGETQAPEKLVEQVHASGLAVDFLVNNAGNLQAGRYDAHPWTDHAQRIRLMAIAPLELTHRLLPGMVAQGWGRIINVSSIAAFFWSTPSDVVYGSVKALVQRFSESVDAEFRDAGVRCTASLPGFTDTELTAEHSNSNRISRAMLMSPETVAREAYEAVMAGRPLVIHGRHHRVLAVVLHYAPLPLRRRLSTTLAQAG